jgi:hypothetical protein
VHETSGQGGALDVGGESMQRSEENARGGVMDGTLARVLQQPQHFERETLLEYSRKTAGGGCRKESPVQSAGAHDVNCVGSFAGLHAAHTWPLLDCSEQQGDIGYVAAGSTHVASTLTSARNKLLQSCNW